MGLYLKGEHDPQDIEIQRLFSMINNMKDQSISAVEVNVTLDSSVILKGVKENFTPASLLSCDSYVFWDEI